MPQGRGDPTARHAPTSARLQVYLEPAGCPRSSYFLPLLPPFELSFTVVFGFFLTVDCFTNRPVMALRPRLPPLDFDGTINSLFRRRR